MNRKQRRAAQKHLSRKSKREAKKLNSALSRVPTKCDECQKPFDNRNQTMLDQWKIAVYDDGPIHLVCPDCVPDDIKNTKR
jgi:hypothetical protein